MRRSVVAALLLLLSLVSAHAADNAPDPLDRALQACLDAPSGQTTAGMVTCTDQAIQAWDKRLNEVYQAALKQLDPKSADLLRNAQRRWVAFRDAEFAALGGPWRNDRGTMISVLAMNTELSAIRERVSELQLYIGDGN